MKALVCLECTDIRALDSANPVTCRCGQATAEWIDPLKGTMRAWGRRDVTRVLGIHNGLFRLAGTGYRQPRDWRTAHEEITAASPGYLFHTDVNNCWVVMIAPGESNDTSWGPPEDRP